VIAGDELRPGTPADADGGAIFKFVPDDPFACGAPLVGGACPTPIASLGDSPFVSGDVFALTASCVDSSSGSFPQYGQGCEIGQGAWVLVSALTARADANNRGATGYYRPEDLHDDPTFAGPGARFCWTNTGDAGADNFAETMCGIDETPEAPDLRVASTGLTYQAQGTAWAVASVNRFIEGDERFNSHDNLAFQPISGRLYVIEDDTFGEIYACLGDGGDRDLKSDGCVAMLSIKDATGEPTGFIFDGTGQTAYYHLQHGGQPAGLLDFTSNPVNGQTDDLIKITGFTAPAMLHP